MRRLNSLIVLVVGIAAGVAGSYWYAHRADTVATRDLPDATGEGTIDAAAISRITLAALSDRFAWIVPKATAIA